VRAAYCTLLSLDQLCFRLRMEPQQSHRAGHGDRSDRPHLEAFRCIPECPFSDDAVMDRAAQPGSSLCELARPQAVASNICPLPTDARAPSPIDCRQIAKPLGENARERRRRLIAPVVTIQVNERTGSKSAHGNWSDVTIKNFGDHAANERTFLAWVRTAIAVMAFGFLVEKFDVFLEVAAPTLASRALSVLGQTFGNVAGLTLVVLGAAMVIVAAVRFLMTAKDIDSEDIRAGTGSRVDIALAALLVLLGVALFFYLSHALIAKL
jgi:putative membrane protein